MDRLIRWALAEFERHRDYDDFLQEARLAVWKSLASGAELPCALSNFVYRRARYAVGDYLRSSRSGIGVARVHRGNRRVIVRLPQIPLEKLDPSSRTTRFEERLVERLEARRLWRQAKRGLRDRERRYLESHYAGERTLDAIGREDGVSGKRVHQVIAAALARCREYLEAVG